MIKAIAFNSRGLNYRCYKRRQQRRWPWQW